MLYKNVKKYQQIEQIEEKKEVEKIEKEKQRKKTLEKRGKPNRSIFVKTLTGKSITVKCWMEDIVLDIKYRIHEIEGIPPDRMRLLWAGKHLDDDRTLSSYNLCYDVTINMVIRFRG